MDAQEWNRRHAAGEHHFGGAPNRFLVAEAGALAPGAALDLACGSGRNAVWLAERGWRVTAVDFSDVALAAGRRLAGERGVDVEWVLADVLEWRPPERAFDLVCLVYLQLPPDERRRVLAGAAGAVAPGGALLVVAHHADNLEHGWGGPKDAEVLATERELAAELPGLEVERAERVLRDVEDAPRPAIDLLVRAGRSPQPGPEQATRTSA